jgi:Fe-S-cluster containining protein
MSPESIAEKARKSLSKFCYEECRAYCCRKGYLVLTKKEAGLIIGKKGGVQLKQLDDGRYSLFMGGSPCPALDKSSFTCTIHKKRGRPKVCKDYPVFISGDKVKLSGRCPAVKQGKLYPYIVLWKRAGCRVVEGFPINDFDVYEK